MQGSFSQLQDVSNWVAPNTRQGPSTDEWAAVKEIIRQLYVNEKRPLKEVRALLEARYGFRAT